MLSEYYVMYKMYIFVIDMYLLISKSYLRLNLILLLLLSYSVVGQTTFKPYESKSKELIFTITPNPMTNGILHFKTADAFLTEIIIFNVLGEKIYINNTYERNLNLQQLRKGIYFIQLKQGEKSGIKRLVVP